MLNWSPLLLFRFIQQWFHFSWFNRNRTQKLKRKKETVLLHIHRHMDDFTDPLKSPYTCWKQENIKQNIMRKKTQRYHLYNINLQKSFLEHLKKMNKHYQWIKHFQIYFTMCDIYHLWYQLLFYRCASWIYWVCQKMWDFESPKAFTAWWYLLECS